MTRSLFLLSLLPALACADPVVLSNVPAYSWTYGCVPTAAAEVLAYWQSHGYPGLMPGATADTSSALPAIAELAADFRTDAAGTTDFRYFWPGLPAFTTAHGYSFTTGGLSTDLATEWRDFTAQIDAGRPMLFTVTPYGDAQIHAVAAFGYDVRPNGPWYAYHDTWSEAETTLWAPFAAALPGVDWGISAEVWIRPPAAAAVTAVPEPGFLGFAAIVLACCARKRSRKRTR